MRTRRRASCWLLHQMVDSKDGAHPPSLPTPSDNRTMIHPKAPDSEEAANTQEGQKKPPTLPVAVSEPPMPPHPDDVLQQLPHFDVLAPERADENKSPSPPHQPTQDKLQKKPQRIGSVPTSPPMVQQRPAQAPAAPTLPSSFDEDTAQAKQVQASETPMPSHAGHAPQPGEKTATSSSGQPTQMQPRKPSSLGSAPSSAPGQLQKPAQAPSDPVLHNAGKVDGAAKKPKVKVPQPPAHHDQSTMMGPQGSSVPQVERTPARPPHVEAPQKPGVDSSPPQQAQVDPSVHPPQQAQEESSVHQPAPRKSPAESSTHHPQQPQVPQVDSSMPQSQQPEVASTMGHPEQPQMAAGPPRRPSMGDRVRASISAAKAKDAKAIAVAAADKAEAALR